MLEHVDNSANNLHDSGASHIYQTDAYKSFQEL